MMTRKQRQLVLSAAEMARRQRENVSGNWSDARLRDVAREVGDALAEIDRMLREAMLLEKEAE